MKYLKYERGLFSTLPPQNDSLLLLQNLVGGYIECVPLLDDMGVDVWCNEEGKLMGLPVSALIRSQNQIVDVIVGPIGFSAFDKDGETLPLSEDLEHQVISRLEQDTV